MDELISYLKSNKELNEIKLKEIRNILVNRSMYEWYIDTEGNEPIKDYLKMLEELGKIYFIEELVSTKCNHIFVWNSDENKYQCVRCGFSANKEISKEHFLQVDGINYYNSCRLYEKVVGGIS